MVYYTCRLLENQKHNTCTTFISYLFCTNTTDSHKQFFLVEKTYREAIDWGME